MKKQKKQRNISTILTKMDLQIVGELNETYELYIFNSFQM